MSTKNLEPEESETASLRQIVEWVAFGLPPLKDKYDRFLRQEGYIRLTYIDDLESPKARAICEAQEKIFIALASGILPAQTAGVAEIEQRNYDRDIPDFKFINDDISGIQTVNPNLWQYDRIYWSDSSLAYDNPLPPSKSDDRFNPTWLLASYIWVDTAKMYEAFPPQKSITKECPQKPPKCSQKPRGRKKGDGSYYDTPHLLKMNDHINNKTAKSIHKAAQKVVTVVNPHY